jgi:hypothetical protein
MVTDDEHSEMGNLRDTLIDLLNGLYIDRVGTIEGKAVRVEVNGETFLEEIVASGPWRMENINEDLVFADGPRDDEPICDSDFSYPATQRVFADAGIADMWLVARLAKRGLECTDWNRPFS